MFVGNLVAQSEFDNDYGTMTMGMGIGRELNKYGKRDFFDFEDYDQVCYNFKSLGTLWLVGILIQGSYNFFGSAEVTIDKNFAPKITTHSLNNH